MAIENFLVNPPHRLRRKRNPIGETLVTIGLNPSRRNPMAQNPWYGDSGGHRIAALMRWGKIPKGRVKRHRKRGRPRVRTVARVVKRRRAPVRRRRVVHTKRGRWAPAAVRLQRKLATQSFWADKYGEILAHPRRKKYHYKQRGVKFYMARHKRRKSRKSNTWFGQPRRHRRAAKKGWRRGHLLVAGSRRRRVRHRNPMTAATVNPRRRHHVRHRRRHHARRRNPAMGALMGRFTGGVMNVRSWAPLAVTGGLSAITGAVVPGMLGVTNPWMKYGVQIGVAVGGSIVVERAVSKEHGQAWMIVGVAMVGYSLLKEFVLQPYFPQFAVGLGAAPGQYESYYPQNSADDVSQRIDAFPSGIHAFPSAMSAYPGVGEAGSYPYDGAGY